MRLSALLALASKVTLPPNYRYGMSRPGSLADKRKNPPGTRRRPVAVEPISDEDWHLFCGDRVRISHEVDWQGDSWGRISLLDPPVLPQVEVLKGKDAGKQGRVIQVIRQRNWVVLEGLNTVSEEWGWGHSGSLSHVSLSIKSSKGVRRLAEGMVRQLNLLFFSMGWMLRAVVSKSPSHPLISDTPSLFRTALPLCWQDQGPPGNHDP